MHEHDAEHGQVLKVEYHSIDGGQTWVPHSVMTSRGEYDCEYSKRHGELYFDKSGSAGRAYLSGYCKPKTLPGRVWIAAGVDVYMTDGSGNTAKTAPTDMELRKRGYVRVHADIPSPFEMANEERAYYCDSLGDYLPEQDTFECVKCGEREDDENEDALLVVFDAQEASLKKPGTYRIKRRPFYMNGMIEGYIIESAVERITHVPKGASGGGYACGFMCAKCSAKFEQRSARTRAA